MSSRGCGKELTFFRRHCCPKAKEKLASEQAQQKNDLDARVQRRLKGA